MRRLRVPLIAFVMIALIALFVILASRRHESQDQTLETSHAGKQLIIGPRDGFLTSAKCRDCHEDEHSRWHATFHRTMTQAASPETLLAPIDDVWLNSRSRTYHLTREGDRFFAEMADPDWEWERRLQGIDLASIADPPSIKREIVMLTGSHHYQTFWIHGRDGNALRQVPFVYHLETAQWIPRGCVFVS